MPRRQPGKEGCPRAGSPALRVAFLRTRLLPATHQTHAPSFGTLRLRRHCARAAGSLSQSRRTLMRSRHLHAALALACAILFLGGALLLSRAARAQAVSPPASAAQAASGPRGAGRAAAGRPAQSRRHPQPEHRLRRRPRPAGWRMQTDAAGGAALCAGRPGRRELGHALYGARDRRQVMAIAVSGGTDLHRRRLHDRRGRGRQPHRGLGRQQLERPRLRAWGAARPCTRWR